MSLTKSGSAGIGTAMSSRFTRMMLQVSVGLSSADLANIKLYVCSEKLLKQDAVDEIQYGADLFRLLLNYRYVSDSNLQLLITMLREIERRDLAEVVKRYRCNCVTSPATDPAASTKSAAQNLQEARPQEHSEECSMTVDEEADSQPSSQDSSASMKSLSDEEKLTLLNNGCDSQDF